MPTISRVSAQQRHPDRVNVFVDGAFAFGIDAASAFSHGLAAGLELSLSEIEELRELDDAAKATDAALRLLAQRPRSINEVCQRLRAKGFAAETISAAIERLEGWNYVGDQAFAHFWVENRATHKPRGKRLIEQELRQKGVDRETVREAIDAVEIDEYADALTLAQSKLRSYGDVEPDVARRRMTGFLARRGYSWGVIKPVLDRTFGDVPDETDSA